MVKQVARRVAFVSSFPPRRCGIARFTSDLIDSVKLAGKNRFQPLVVALLTGKEHEYDEPVKFEIRQGVKNDYIRAADYINFSNIDVVSVQHEFGLFGGDGGKYINLLLNRLNAPVITTLHTVLEEPTEDLYESLLETSRLSYKLVTMNERGVIMLRDVYGVDKEKIELISHGIPDLPFVDSNYYKYRFGMEGRRTILTFGLLSRNKGIEVMLRAMPSIIEADPSVLYVILGMTHPMVLKHEGEAYRFRLQQMVKELKLEEHVVFQNRFVNDEELHNFLCSADIYVTPYLSREQLTSGTLSYAVGTGKAVVSTPYWAATELLAEGRGELVQFGDHKQLGQVIVELLKDEKHFYSLRKHAYDYGRSRTWPQIGKVYWDIFRSKKLPIRVASKAVTALVEGTKGLHIPEPSLAHLKRLTDDTGMYQHAKFTIPDRRHGYATDDNSRAVLVAMEYYGQFPENELLRLLDIYLSFLMSAQRDDGTIRNFMNFDRRWVENEPKHDALGRTLWAWGAVISKPPSLSYLPIVKECFDRTVGHSMTQSPRGRAYSILGMCKYLEQFQGASDIKRCLTLCADSLYELYWRQQSSQWRWFEEILTYDNAVLPHALFSASHILEDAKYLDVARESTAFLAEQTYNGEHFSFIGCNGWYPRDGERADFDQQPIEAAGTVLLMSAAFEATGENKYLELQRKAFDWFVGKNDLHLPVYDFKTKGCHDGLMPGGVNLNEGAESTLCYMLSLLSIIENYVFFEESKNDVEENQSTTGRVIPSDEMFSSGTSTSE